LLDFSYVSFFIYTSTSFIVSLGQYAILARRNTKAFTPVQFLPGFTIMLAGVLASIIAPAQSPQRAGIVVATGLVAQGAGFGLSCACVVFFFRAVLDNGFPPPKVRPALFIPVGALAYTVVAVVGLADGIPAQEGYFGTHPTAKEVCKVVALVAGLFMWGFAVWLCVFAIGANVLVVKEMRFALAWWAFVFPNVGLVIATSMIGRELECEPLLWVASGMTVGVVVMWIVAAVGCVRAVWKGEIVWPGKDEDKDL
jgi:tellurite resistance protein TehA-like permease